MTWKQTNPASIDSPRTSILVSFLLCAVLTGQVLHNPEVPLRNWPAPLYWQPAAPETESSGMRAEIRAAAPHAGATSSPLVFIAMTPCRVVDTRASQMFPNPFGPPHLSAGPARSFPIQSNPSCSIPSTARAYSFNVTVIPPGGLGYLILWPTGQSQPNAVTLDDITGDIRNNVAIVPAGTPNGSISAVVNATTDLVIDINGYYAPLNAADFGNSNTAIGLSALYSNTTGSANTATGFAALGSNTTGSNNTASGSGALFNNTTGSGNSAHGFEALGNNTTGINNTASGYQALLNNIAGNANTASGHSALNANTTGAYNTASGYQALLLNTTGSYNTASGAGALSVNTTGCCNTASGYFALFANTTGENNTADGDGALFTNSTGSNNTASGAGALSSNTNGSDNTASGVSALVSNTSGTENTATGENALLFNTTGSDNTASGMMALSRNTTGSNNTALGFLAGDQIGTGNNNIDIGHEGTGADSGVIRIGTPGTQTSFFASGIAGVPVSNSAPVLININNGQLGTVNSSRRYKEDIQDMSEASSGLLKLRPVTFRYQKPYADGSKPIDYGLIAEEVAEVYPDLVARGADGQLETVQYHKLVPMLLNELQKLQAIVAALQKAQALAVHTGSLADAHE